MVDFPITARYFSLLTFSTLLLCLRPATAQQLSSPVVTAPIVQTAPIPIPPPMPVKPIVEAAPPANQLAAAISNHDVNKVASLLAADASLAKTPTIDGTPPLVSAVRTYGHDSLEGRQILQKLLDSGADVNAADPEGMTPLQILAFDGHADVEILMLLNKGANVNATSTNGTNALLNAVEIGDPGTVNLLLSHGADVNSRTAYGDTPLHVAITHLNQSQSLEIIDALLRAGANVNLANDLGDMPLHLAVRQIAQQALGGTTPYPSLLLYEWGDRREVSAYSNPALAQLVPELLNRGAQINARNQSGLTPLLIALLYRDKVDYAVLMQHHPAMDTLTKVFSAAATNDVANLARLLKSLPDAKDLRAPTGATALHIAALWNAPSAVRLLLYAGLEASARDAAKETPLHYACCFPENSAIVSLLLNAGANINAEDGLWTQFGATPLLLAVWKNSPQILRLLLARKANPNLPTSGNWTPLWYAVAAGDVDMAKALINAGATMNGRLQSSNLLVKAITIRNVPLVALLLANGADVNYFSHNTYGDVASPLMVAIQTRNKAIVQMLLDKGANANYKSRQGGSILDVARSNPDSGIADLLIQHGAK